MDFNGTGWMVAKVLAGTLLSLVLLVGAPMLISNVIANERLSRERDIRIDAEYKEADKEITHELVKVTNEIKKEATEAKVEQTKMNGELLGSIKALNVTTKHAGEQIRNVAIQLEKIANNGR